MLFQAAGARDFELGFESITNEFIDRFIGSISLTRQVKVLKLSKGKLGEDRHVAMLSLTMTPEEAKELQATERSCRRHPVQEYPSY
jgi:hypothetical protein